MRGRSWLEKIAAGAIVLAGSVFVGCPTDNSGGGSNNPPTNSHPPSKQVVVVPTSGAGSLQSVYGNELGFSRGGETILAGDYLVGGISPLFDEGYLRRVVDVQEKGGLTVVTTAGATLPEAFPNSEFILERIVSGKNMNESSLNLVRFEYILNDVKFGEAITLNGYARVDANADLSFRTEGGQVKHFRSWLDGEATIKLDPELSLLGVVDKDFGEKRFAPVKIIYAGFVGPIPLYGGITIDGRINAQSYLEGQFIYNCVAEGSVGVNLGAEFSEGAWSGGGGVNSSLGFSQDMEFSGDAGLRVTPGFGMNISVWGMQIASTGIYLQTDLRAHGEFQNGLGAKYAWGFVVTPKMPFKIGVDAFGERIVFLEKENILNINPITVASGQRGLEDLNFRDEIVYSFSHSFAGDYSSGGNIGGSTGGTSGGGGIVDYGTCNGNDDTRACARILTFSDGRANWTDSLGGTDEDWYQFVVSDPNAKIHLTSAVSGDLEGSIQYLSPQHPDEPTSVGLGNFNGDIAGGQYVGESTAGRHYLRVYQPYQQSSGNYTLSLELH